MMAHSHPRYERIVPLVLVVAIGLAVVLFIDGDPNILRARLGGDLPTITVSWLLIGVLVLIVSTGADLLARSHPEMQTRALPVLNLGIVRTELAPGFWILPSLCIISGFAFFRLFRTSLLGWAFVLALLTAGGLLLLVLAAQHYALERNPEVHQRARLVLQLVAYALAFGIFSAVYYERLRTLYAAVLIGGAGLLLAFAVLRWASERQAPLLAACVGLLLAEATWALNYWPASFLLGGALLLALLYVAVSLLQHHLAGTLQRRIVLEYSLVGGGLLLSMLLLTFVPG